jgi:ribonuclease BN (tRNA processing enzyme)
MRVLLLGTAGYHPNDQRHTSCILLPDFGIALDAGTGMYRVGRHLTTKTLDIFLSHTHLDHVVGLSFFFSLLAEKSVDRITVHGDSRKLVAVRDQLFSDNFFPVKPAFEWEPLSGELTLANGVVVRSFRLEHPGGATGYRLAVDGKSIAYVSDTSATSGADYIQHIRGVDLLLHECNFPNGESALAKRTGHSCIDDVAKVATEAAVKRLILVHFDPLMAIPPEDLASAKRIFPGLMAGEDNMEINV